MTARDYAQGPIMAAEVMVRILEAQAEAIWPQEEPLLRRYRLRPAPRILDVGCGTGEVTVRLAAAFPEARLTGVDLVEAHLERARARGARFADRLDFAQGDAYALDLPKDTFDLCVCRHMLQAIDDPARVVDELVRVARPGGVLHLLAEDYAMIRFHPTRHDIDAFWQRGPIAACARTGADLRQGRKAFTLLRRQGLREVRVDYVHVDTQRVPRPVFVRIWEAWAEGYAAFIAEHSDLDRAEVDACFADMIACLEDPDGWASWTIPVVSGVVP